MTVSLVLIPFRSALAALIAATSFSLCLWQWQVDLSTRRFELADWHIPDSAPASLDRLHPRWNRSQLERSQLEHSLLDQQLQRRGLHLLTPLSGCRMAAWVYYNTSRPRKWNDCRTRVPVGHERLLTHAAQNAALLPFDTVYVTIKSLPDFVTAILPHLVVPIVLMAGQYHKSGSDLLPVDTVHTLLHHPMVSKWWCHNIPVYIPSRYTHHVRLEPWPLGVAPRAYHAHEPDPLVLYARAFGDHHGLTTKTRHVFAGHQSPYTNPQRTRDAPSGPRILNRTEYYDAVARSRYIVAPNGDRPECYRHYEAIGLGTIPLTQLDATLHRHLQPGPVVYGLGDYWNLSNTTLWPVSETNRRMVTEEYWIEHVQQIMAPVTTRIRWSDVLQNDTPVYYDEFAVQSTVA